MLRKFIEKGMRASLVALALTTGGGCIFDKPQQITRDGGQEVVIADAGDAPTPPDVPTDNPDAPTLDVADAPDATDAQADGGDGSTDAPDATDAAEVTVADAGDAPTPPDVPTDNPDAPTLDVADAAPEASADGGDVPSPDASDATDAPRPDAGDGGDASDAFTCLSPGQMNCGGTCVNTLTDNANCGGCRMACPPTATCTAGTCVCPTGQLLCGGTCVNPQIDRTHCGRCGNACGAMQTCVAGACTPCSMAGQVSCSNVCTDIQTDRTNCGRCGGACPSSATCTAGRCRLVLTAVRLQGFWVEDIRSWSEAWSATQTDWTDLPSAPTCVGTFGYTSSGRVGYNNTRLAVVFPRLPVPSTQVRRAYLNLTRAGHRDDPPQFVNVVRAPCGSSGWARTDYNRTLWGSESFGERAASDFPIGVARTLPDLETLEGASGLRLRDAGGRELLSSTGENCLGLRTRADLVDLTTMPGFSPAFRAIPTGGNTALLVSPSAQLVVETAP